MNPASLRLFVLAVLGVLVAREGFAHDLKAEVNPASNPIRVVAGFDDDTPAEGARLIVKDEAGQPIYSGTLDERGAGSFPRPGPGRYQIIVEQAGHRDVVELFVPEAAPATAFSRWRLDKSLGLFLGIAILLGGAWAYTRIRRFRHQEGV